MTPAVGEYRVTDLFTAQARRQRTLTLSVSFILLSLAIWGLFLGGEQNVWFNGLLLALALVQAIEPIYGWRRARRSRVVADEHSLTLIGPGINQRIELEQLRMARIHDDRAGKPRGLHLFPSLDRDFELGPVEGLDALVALVLARVPSERVLRVRW